MAKKTKKAKKQRKLLLALLMLLLTFVTLSTSTYAWFTANKTVTVSSINVNVAAANGLQISVDAIEWKAIITNDDINRIINTHGTADDTYPTSTNQLPASELSLAPVSTVGTVDTSGFMEMFLGEIDADNAGNYKLKSTKSTETSTNTGGHFVAFDLFFQVQGETPIYLTDAAQVVAGGTDSGIHNASRVAFIIEGTKEAGTAASDIQVLKSQADPIIWEPNYDVHTPSAVQHAANTYSITTSIGPGAAQIPYYGLKTAFGEGVALTNTDTDKFGAVTIDISTPASGITTAAYQPVFTLPAGVTKVRVYMWIEGQDVDCENNASGGEITFDLQFSSNASVSG